MNNNILMAFLIFACCSGYAAESPNVIIMLADDLGYNDLSSYRSKKPFSPKPSTSQTPWIDSIGDDGIRFTDFYCGAPVCSPSRVSLLTGRNSSRVGIFNWVPPQTPVHLRQRELTIAEMLKEGAYSTAHFGKWHLHSDNRLLSPKDHGFDYEFYTSNNAKPSHRNPVNFIRNGKKVGKLEGYSCQLVTDEALGWLDKRDTAKPFYINLWFHESHNRVAAPKKLSSKHKYNSEYYGCIENMDNAVGRVLGYLKENGLDTNTLVIFSSDNGSYLHGSNDPLRGGKSYTYDGGVRVPFMIRWPGQIPAGKVSRFPGSFTDILPTLATLTGTKKTIGRVLDGMDLTRILKQPEQVLERSKPIFFHRYTHDPVSMMRIGDWILLGYEKKPGKWQAAYDSYKDAKMQAEPGKKKWSNWFYQPSHEKYMLSQKVNFFELYNAADDISQRTDLAAQHPERVAQMKKTMLRLRSEVIAGGGIWFP